VRTSGLHGRWVTSPGSAADRLVGGAAPCPRGSCLIGIALPCWQVSADMHLLRRAGDSCYSTAPSLWNVMQGSSAVDCQALATGEPCVQYVHRGSLDNVLPPCVLSLQGKLVEGDRNLGPMRLLGPGVEVHTLPRVLDITAKFPLDQAIKFGLNLLSTTDQSSVVGRSTTD
jgi:hypothetical protein